MSPVLWSAANPEGFTLLTRGWEITALQFQRPTRRILCLTRLHRVLMVHLSLAQPTETLECTNRWDKLQRLYYQALESPLRPLMWVRMQSGCWSLVKLIYWLCLPKTMMVNQALRSQFLRLSPSLSSFQSTLKILWNIRLDMLTSHQPSSTMVIVFMRLVLSLQLENSWSPGTSRR